jgi:hypothetical protein
VTGASLSARFEENRPRLRAVAYRMLGPTSEAEDAVRSRGSTCCFSIERERAFHFYILESIVPFPPGTISGTHTTQSEQVS